MNHHSVLHIERLAHGHHAQLMEAAAARRHVAQGRRSTSGAVRTTAPAPRRRRLHHTVGLAVAGLVTFAGGAQVDASAATVEHVCDMTDVQTSERSFGRFLRAV